MIEIKDFIDSKIDEMKDEIVESVQEIVRIKSVEGEPGENKPFGEGVNQCLEATLAIAERLGLKNKNIDGYAGHVEIGEGEEILGILCHLDVVPEGSNWTYPPYGAEIHDGKIYGRGTIDNKGPAIAALYALKAVQDSGIKLNKRVRLILGTNEESGWGCINYYLKKEETPALAFSPDAEFPVIHGEKGILTFILKKSLSRVEGEKITSIEIQGGNAANMIPDYCQAIIETAYPDLFLEALVGYREKNPDVKLEMEKNNKRLLIKSYGVSAHGSLPEDGYNAISQLMVFLAELDVFSPELQEILSFYKNKIGLEYNGESLGCRLEDEVSGPLTFNVGTISLKDKELSITINIRYPVTSAYDEVKALLLKGIKEMDFLYEEISHQLPLYVEKDHPLVEKLMQVYQKYTGDMREPITIGGGTYARALDNAVAFGPLFPGQEELAHQKDEYIGIDDLILNTKIYAAAIIELAKG